MYLYKPFLLNTYANKQTQIRIQTQAQTKPTREIVIKNIVPSIPLPLQLPRIPLMWTAANELWPGWAVATGKGTSNYNDGVYHNVKKCLVVKTGKVKRIVGARMHKYTCKQTYTYTTYAHAHTCTHTHLHIHIHNTWMDGRRDDERTDGSMDRQKNGRNNRQTSPQQDKQTDRWDSPKDRHSRHTDRQTPGIIIYTSSKYQSSPVCSNNTCISIRHALDIFVHLLRLSLVRTGITFWQGTMSYNRFYQHSHGTVNYSHCVNRVNRMEFHVFYWIYIKKEKTSHFAGLSPHLSYLRWGTKYIYFVHRGKYA